MNAQRNDLGAILARVDKASEGPWFAVRDDDEGMGAVDNRTGEIVSESYETGDGDLAFIAHARTDVPALVAEVRELRFDRFDLLAALKGALAAWKWEADQGDGIDERRAAVYEVACRAIARAEGR